MGLSRNVLPRYTAISVGNRIFSASDQGGIGIGYRHLEWKQVAQLMLTNPRDALRGQSRSPNIVLFDMLGACGFLLVFYSNFVPKMHRF